MGPYSNLAEHLIAALNVVCGRYLREGELIPNPGVLAPGRVRREEAAAPDREWERGPRSAVHGLGRVRGQMMSAVLADEILDAGERRIRALICVGGNPAAALPGQARALEALQSLDLLVTIDPRLSRTAELAHYVIPPRLQYERPDHTGGLEALFPAPYANYTPALIEPPAESDMVDDWYALWRIAREMGLALRWNGVDVPMETAPTTDDLLELFAATARIPLDQVKAAGRGRFYPAEVQVQPPGPGAGRLDLLAADVAAELARLAQEAPPSKGFRLTVRRQREVMNSTLTDFDTVRARRREPAAHLHPRAIARLGLTPGDRVLIRSGVGEIEAEVATDADLREDVVSIAHCWEAGPSRAATSALVDPARELQSINRMPVMTAILVSIEPVGGGSPPDVTNDG
jgi:anaerobic selenocysteine-containing dehydrogenase